MRAGFHAPKRLFAGCAFTLWLFFTPAHAQTSESTASLRGVVTNASGGGGLRKAYLLLSPTIGSKGGVSFTAVTNDQGAFAIENIAPGEYRLDVECTGFLETQYGGGSSFGERSVLKLSPGDKLSGIEIKMTPQAVLSGRVLAQDGDPWPHARVSIFRVTWKKGKRSVQPADSTTLSPDVDDRGEFRMAGLAPGSYYVRAEPDQWWEREHRSPAARQQPTWYPSSPDAESSTPLILAAGQQSPEIEIRLRSGAGSTFRIRGKVAGLTEIPSPRGDPRMGQRRIWARRISTEADVEQSPSGNLAADGSFAIPSVPSGSYEIWVAQGTYPPTTLGHATVQVDDRDVEGVSIQLYAPQTLRSNLKIEGSEGTESPGSLIYLEGTDLLDRWPTARDDGSLEFQEVGVGRYRVRLWDSARPRFYLKSVRYGNEESSDGSFTLVPDGGPLEVVLSARGARVTGALLRDGKTTTPRVVLIPDTDDAARRENLSRSAVFDQNGVFTIKAIAPGSYKLYGFESVPDDIWLVPDFLKEVESFGAAFKAAEGDLKTIQLPLVGKAETDRILAKLGLQN
jgi:Carboxypeptidase regulatory-like domain